LFRERLRTLLAALDAQGDDIEALKEAVRSLQVENGLTPVKLEGIAARAAGEATGALSRRLGCLERRAGRD
jgi:hypothetical protein